MPYSQYIRDHFSYSYVDYHLEEDDVERQDLVSGGANKIHDPFIELDVDDEEILVGVGKNCNEVDKNIIHVREWQYLVDKGGDSDVWRGNEPEELIEKIFGNHPDWGDDDDDDSE